MGRSISNGPWLVLRRQFGPALAVFTVLALAGSPTLPAVAQPTGPEGCGASAASGSLRGPDAALAVVRGIEEEADLLWQAALAGDWFDAKAVLEAVHRSVDTLHGGPFEAAYVCAGGRLEALDADRYRLDIAIGQAEVALAAQSAPSLMLYADRLLLAAADLTGVIAPRARWP